MNRLDVLLDRYAEASSAPSGTARADIEQAIWQEFGIEQAVFVLDMAGFSRLVQRRGLVRYLSLVHRMRETVAPIVARCGGDVVKFAADNGFARFAAPQDAIAAGLAINHALAETNRALPEEDDIEVSIGIDFGRFLLVPESDFYGEPVNLACKLGEDIAVPGEILVTERAMQQIADDRFDSEPVSFMVSGVDIAAHRIDAR